jgi:hypothetical protein
VTAGPAEIEAAVLRVEGVAALHGGAFGEIGTYLPGHRVPGIRLVEQPERAIDIHIVAESAPSMLAAAAAVRHEVHRLTGLPVIVTVEDFEDTSLKPPAAPAPEITEGAQ